MEANGWGPAAAIVHLRHALQDGAQDCGRVTTIPAIFEVLRARYEISSREARMKLSTLRKEQITSLQKHVAEVRKSVRVAPANLPKGYRTRMVLETFCNTLGNAYLQRHLLAVDTPTLEAAI